MFIVCGEVTCVQCYGMGDVSNLVMCSVCGQHYHGTCVGLALLPGVRAGWQCVSCRVCQVCRQPEDVSKVTEIQMNMKYGNRKRKLIIKHRL